MRKFSEIQRAGNRAGRDSAISGRGAIYWPLRRLLRLTALFADWLVLDVMRYLSVGGVVNGMAMAGRLGRDGKSYGTPFRRSDRIGAESYGIAAGAVGRVRFFVEAFAALQLMIVAEEIGQPFGRIDGRIIVITESNNGGVLIQTPDKHRAVAVPPAIVIDKFLAVRDQQHPPAQAIITLTGLFEAVAGIGAVQHALGK